MDCLFTERLDVVLSGSTLFFWVERLVEICGCGLNFSSNVFVPRISSLVTFIYRLAAKLRSLIDHAK